MRQKLRYVLAAVACCLLIASFIFGNLALALLALAISLLLKQTGRETRAGQNNLSRHQSSLHEDAKR
ncbi:hypothetical protein [Brevibacillus fulvus]|uniref:Membrane protein n=1 Tax=Brevibacillus fulvus TaxID=1125967 RepID=A0A939BU53_9BACL|nr:hypothetical protein [Brevibacillus fulvus]MBM7589156.1 putative membrane protein [Brevibacillus fulvus]